MTFRTLRTYLGIIVLALAAGLLLSEAFVRLTGDYWALYQFRERSLEYEPSLFARNVFPRRVQEAQRDPDVHYRINEHGFRGDSFPLEKPEGTTRVMIYGGSAVFDIFAGRREDWPNRVERRLQGRGHEHVRVINAGIPGNASFDVLGRLLAEGHWFDPDVVVLYQGWNDIEDTIQLEEPLLRAYDPSEYLRYVELGDPRITYQNPIDRVLGRWSQLYLRLRLQYYRWYRRLGRQGRRPEKRTSGDFHPASLRQFRLNLRSFVHLVRSMEATPVLMTQARLVAPGNRGTDKLERAEEHSGLDHERLIDAYSKLDRMTEEVAREEGVTLIDASKAMTGQSRYFGDHVHTSARGSRTLASLTADRLESLLEP